MCVANGVMTNENNDANNQWKRRINENVISAIQYQQLMYHV